MLGRQTDKQESENVHLVNKNLGETPLEAINRFKKDNPEFVDLPVTYAGRLDPMAEGLLILLSGDKVIEKEKYLDLSKTYEFEVLWGFTTDTLDILGIAERGECIVPAEETFNEFLKIKKGKFEQMYPVYSSRPVKSKPLFEWAREGRLSEINIPKHSVEILHAEHLSRRKILAKDLLPEIISRVSLVNGDFRQLEIMEKWKEVLGSDKNKEFIIDKFKLEVSSGFYIRQFVADLMQNFKSYGTTYGIRRTKIGSYAL